MPHNVNVTLHTVHGQRRAGTSHLRGAYFVLQLHDELIYETTEQDLIQVWTFAGSGERGRHCWTSPPTCNGFLPLSGGTDSQDGDGVSSETVRKTEGQSQGWTQLGKLAGPRPVTSHTLIQPC